MSQYPSPYQPPPYQPPEFVSYGGPPGGVPSAWLAAGRRAGALMIVFGGLLLALGACDTFQAVLASPAQIQESIRRQQEMMGGGGPTVPAGFVRGISAAFGLVLVAAGGTFVGLGVAVRRGGRRATIAGTVVTSVVLAGVGLFFLFAVLAILVTPVAGIVMAGLLSIPTALAVLQLVFLIQAVRTTGRFAAAQQQQYAAYYAHYQHASQAYGSGYGYGYPPQPGAYAGQGLVDPPPPPPPPAE